MTEHSAVFHVLKMVMHFIFDHSHFSKDGQLNWYPKASQAAHQRLSSISASQTPSDTHPMPTGASFPLAENSWLCEFANLRKEVSPNLSPRGLS